MFIPFVSATSAGFTITVQSPKRTSSGAVGTKRLSLSGKEEVNLHREHLPRASKVSAIRRGENEATSGELWATPNSRRGRTHHQVKKCSC